jgi:hypothetical protein
VDLSANTAHRGVSYSCRSYEWYQPKVAMVGQENLPSPRLGHAAAVYDDKLFLFGGHTVGIDQGGMI